jgi:hypothetical protein
MTHRRRIRAGIDFQWQSRNWTYNAFRLFELLFGAPVGIRKTTMAAQYEKDGRIVTERAFFTWEALLAHAEYEIRQFLTSFSIPRFEWVPVQQLVYAHRGMAQKPIYVLAIARDVNSIFTNATGTTTRTFATVNVTGSNPAVVHGFTAASTDTATTGSFNSVSMTQERKVQTPSARWSYLYYLAGTAANAACVINFTGSPDFCGGVTSAYSGVNPGAADSSTTNTATGASSLTVTTTVVANNSWLAGWWYSTAGTAISAGTGASMVANNSGNLAFFDSNGAVASGSRSMQGTASSGNWGGSMLSMAPVAATGPTHLKSRTGVPKANLKSVVGVALANLKSITGIGS